MLQHGRAVVGLLRGFDGGLHIGPKTGGVEQVLVIHRVEQRFDQQVAEAERLEQQRRLGGDGEQFFRRPEHPARLEAGRRGFDGVDGRAETGGIRFLQAVGPIVRLIQVRSARHRIEVAIFGLIVVVSTRRLRRSVQARERRRVPERDVAVQPRGRFFGVQAHRVRSRRPVRGEQVGFAWCHGANGSGGRAARTDSQYMRKRSGPRSERISSHRIGCCGNGVPRSPGSASALSPATSRTPSRRLNAKTLDSTPKRWTQRPNAGLNDAAFSPKAQGKLEIRSRPTDLTPPRSELYRYFRRPISR